MVIASLTELSTKLKAAYVGSPDVTKRTAFDWRGEPEIYKALYRFTLRLLHKRTLSSRMKYMIPYDT